MKKDKNKKGKVSIEILIICAIACCMIFLINFSNAKINELISTTEQSLLFKDAIDVDQEEFNEEFAEKILCSRPEPYKMIEGFTQDFQLIFRIEFDEHETDTLSEIKNNTELVDFLKEHEYGHTRIDIDGKEEDIYFQWVDNSTTGISLILVYMSKANVNNLWVIPMSCYIILILICILLIRFLFIQNQIRIDEYNRSSERIRTK